MKTLYFFTFFLSATIFFTACKEKENKIKSQTEIEMKFQAFKKDMFSLGETSIDDTQNHNRILYFGNWIYTRERLISLRNVKNDTALSFISYSKYDKAGVWYNSDTGFTKPPYLYIQGLRKVCYNISRKQANSIFNIFDSLVIHNLIFPFGEGKKADKSGMIIDGGNWLVYYDGKKFYEYNDMDYVGLYLDPLWDSLCIELNTQDLNEALNDRIP